MTDELNASYWIENKNYDQAIKFGSQAVDSLIEVLLSSKYPQEDRIRAAEALGQIGDSHAIPALVNALTKYLDVQSYINMNMEIEWETGRSNPIGKAAIYALGKFQDPALIKPLLLAVKETRTNTNEVTEVITSLGVKAVPVLIAALSDFELQGINDPNPINILGAIGDSAAIDPIMDILKSRGLASICLEGLSKIKHSKTFEVLRPYVSISGSQALSKQQDSPESPWKIRSGIIKCLGDLGDKRAKDVLVDELLDVNIPISENRDIPAALDKLGWKPKKDPAGVRYWLLKGELKKIVAVPEISFDILLSAVQNASETDYMRIQVVKALGEIKDPRAVIPLKNVVLAKLAENPSWIRSKERNPLCMEAILACSQIVKPNIDKLEEFLYTPDLSPLDLLDYYHSNPILVEYFSLLDAVTKSRNVDVITQSEAEKHQKNFQTLLRTLPWTTLNK